MKCPRCGSEMQIDTHRKYSIPMCYECGYMEGRNMGEMPNGKTNFERLKAMNFNEATKFISAGLKLTEDDVDDWLNSISEF